MATNKNNVNDVDNNIFIISGDEQDRVPYDYGGMPEYTQEDKKALSITVRFRNKEDLEEFSSMMDQIITDKTKSIWYPAIERDTITLLRWVDEDDY